jgi:hypothetical protein
VAERFRHLLHAKVIIMEANDMIKTREPWNKGKLVGEKAPLKPKDGWAIRVRLQMEERARELALFRLGTDSKLPRLRSDRVACSRHLSRRPRCGTRVRAAAQKATAGPVRDHGADEGGRGSLDLERRAPAGRLPLP